MDRVIAQGADARLSEMRKARDGRQTPVVAALRCFALRQSFTEARSTCGNRGSIELNWAWLSGQDNSPLRAYLLSRGFLVQSICLRDSRGSKLGKMFPGLGFARFNEAVSRTELRVVGGRG